MNQFNWKIDIFQLTLHGKNDLFIKICDIYKQSRFIKFHPLISSYNFKFKILMILPKIIEMRSIDKVKQLTYPNANVKFSITTIQALYNVLEEMDVSESRRKAKFYARTIFISLAINGGDMMDSLQVANSTAKSSIYQACKISEDQGQFDIFIQNMNHSQLGQYYSSHQHQQILNTAHQLFGENLKISTPYDFTEIAAKQLGIANFEILVSYLVDLSLTIPETYQMTSEEIFVGCCLYVCQKKSIVKVQMMLNNYFQGSLVVGNFLKEKLKQLCEDDSGLEV